MYMCVCVWMGGEVCVTNGGDLVAKKLLLAHKTLPFVWCKWQEVQHYRESGLPSRAPNSMNNYGLVLNERHGCKQVAAGIEGKEICESSHHSSEFWDLWKWMTLVQCFAKDRFATSFLCALERSSPSYRREARNVWHKSKAKKALAFLPKALAQNFHVCCVPKGYLEVMKIASLPSRVRKRRQKTGAAQPWTTIIPS